MEGEPPRGIDRRHLKVAGSTIEPVNSRKAAAATWFFCGGLTLLSALRSFVRPPELSPYNQVWNAFLFQYGGALSGLVVGSALLSVGLLTLRAKDPADDTKELNFIYEAEIPLAPVMSAFLLWIGIIDADAILPYTGERGIVPGQLGVSLVLIPMMFGGAWFLLHYRRMAILNSASRTFEISYGKPWPVLRRRAEFSAYDSVAIEEVQRQRGSVFRLVASGPKGSRLITFTFNADSAKQCAENIVQVTGWKRGDARK